MDVEPEKNTLIAVVVSGTITMLGIWWRGRTETKKRVTIANSQARTHREIAESHTVDAIASERTAAAIERESIAATAKALATNNSSLVADLQVRLGRQEGITGEMDKEVKELRKARHDADNLATLLTFQIRQYQLIGKQIVAQNAQLRFLCDQLLKDHGKTQEEIAKFLPPPIEDFSFDLPIPSIPKLSDGTIPKS